MKALVIYGTRWGGTTSIARKIGESLSKVGFGVSVVDARNTTSEIAEYDLVVVGSGIRADKWTKSALEFLGRNTEILKSKKTALFASCQMADREDATQKTAKKKYLLDVAEKYHLKPVAFGFFGGYVDFKKSHGIIVDIIVRVNRKKLLAQGFDTHKVHDTRNWESIEAWAKEVARLSSCA